MLAIKSVRPWGADAVAWLVWLLALLLLEASALDMQLARLLFSADHGAFLWRDAWFTTAVSHDGLRWIAGAAFTWIAVGVRWPLGVLRRLSASERLTLLVTTLASLLAIPLLKQHSYVHCPWDLVEFGGRAAYLRLFDWPTAGTSRGQCFPAGHVSAATAFFGGWFAFRRRDPLIARAWLAIVLLFARWTGLAQQARGAHFLSHNLWTAWICYGIALGAAFLSSRRPR